MIRFFYRAGSDEVRTLLTNSILADLEAGGKALLLVPEQETVAVERRMLEALPPAAQLTFEVVNFSRLANRTFRTLGGLSHRAATPAVAALVMWQTVGRLLPELKQYGSGAARDSALCELMLQTEAQCKAACITGEDLLQAAEQLPQGEPLRDKLTDIGLLLGFFEGQLGERFDNAADDLTRLADTLNTDRGKKLFADTHIYVDSFTDFTVQEQHVLRALFSAAPTVTVTFPLRNAEDDGLHLKAVRNTYRLLFDMAKELGQNVICENPTLQKTQSALDHLAQNLFRMDAEPAPLALQETGEIRLFSCSSPFEEATAAATEIHRLVRTGCRYRDITIVVREASDWTGILDATLEKEGIPCFLAEKTDITTLPLIKLILEALRIRLGNWREEDVVGYLKAGLCGIAPNDINLFEEYVNVWHPRGEKAYNGGSFTKNPDGYTSQISQRGARILEGANRVREAITPPLCTLFAALDAAPDATALCRALYEFLETLQVPTQLKEQAKARLTAGERREAEELSRLYNVLVDALEDIVTAIGDRKLSVAEFADALKLVFSRTDIGSIPTSADEVTVGSASMLRADHPKFVLVLGLNEGHFPKNITDEGLLGTADREKLRELGVNFPVDHAKLASDELFFLYRAFRAPRQGLFLYYATSSTDGRALTPSIAVTRLQHLFPRLKPLPFTAQPPMERIYTVNGALETLGEFPKDTADALLHHLEAEGVAAARALRRPVVDPDAFVSQTIAKRLFSQNRFSPTHLDKFAGCRFAYYCSKILHLREEANGTVSTNEIGTFIHHVLEHTVRAIREADGDFAACDAQKQAEIVDGICADYRLELQAAGVDFSPTTAMLFDRLNTLAHIIVSGIFEEFADSSFTPAFLELDPAAFGERTTVSIGDTTVPLTGTADRVDFWQDADGTAYLRVIDYKTGTREFSREDIDKGFSLQMPLYLLTLCRGEHPTLARELGLPADTHFAPAGVSYLSSAIGTELTERKRPRDEALQDAVNRLVRNGVNLDTPSVLHALSHSGRADIIGPKKNLLSQQDFEEMFDAVERTITRIAGEMRSGAAEARPHKKGAVSPCNYCAFTAICRAAKKNR